MSRHQANRRNTDRRFQAWSRPTLLGLTLLGLILLTVATTGATERSNAGPLYQHCRDYQKQQYEILESSDAVKASWRPIGPRSYELYGKESLFGGLGRILTLAFDPRDKNVIYAGSGTGPLWRSSDAGQTWKTISDSLGISGIAITPTDPKKAGPENPHTIYILTGSGSGSDGNSYFVTSSGVFKAIDYGNDGELDWEPTSSLSPKDYVGYTLDMSPHDPEVLFVPTNQGLYKTPDGGKEWTRVLPGYVFDVEFNPAKPSIVYSASVQKDWTGPAEIRRSVTGGAKGEWMIVSSIGNLGSYPRIELAVTPKDPSRVYAIVGSGSGFRGLYRSTNDGQHFTLISNTPGILGWDEWRPWGFSFSHYEQTWMNLNLAAHPDNADEVWAASVVSWRSVDGGAHWQPGTFWNQTNPMYEGWALHVDFHDLEYHERHLFAATDGGVYKRDADANRWTDLSRGLEITQVYKLCGSPEDADILYFGAQDGGSYQLTDAESGASRVLFNLDGMGCLVDPENRNRIYVSGNNGNIFKSTDGGKTFVAVSPVGVSGKGSWTTPFIASPSEPDNIFACYSDVWETENGGGLWVRISEDGAAGSGNCVEVATAPAHEHQTPEIYVARGCSVYKGREIELGESNWNGEWEWDEILNPHDAAELLGQPSCDPEAKPSIRGLAVNPKRSEEVWVTFNGFSEKKKVFKGIPKTYRDPNAAETYMWENLSGQRLPNVSANTLLFAGDSVNGTYLGMDCGLFYRDDTLTDWVPYFENLPWPDTMIQDLLLQKKADGRKILRAASFSQGIWESATYEEQRERQRRGAKR